MYILKTSVFLATLMVVYAFPRSSENDKKTLDNILECVKQKMPEGVPEIGYPSHNPLFFKYNFTFGVQAVVLKWYFTVFDGYYYGIPDYQVTLNQLSDDSADVAEFDYQITWPKIFIDAKWAKTVGTNGTDVQTSGLMNMTVTDPLWKGSVKIRKPFLSGTIEDLTVDYNAISNAEIGVTNFDEFENFLFTKLFKYIWTWLFDSSLFGNYVQKALKAHFQGEWLDQPERFQKLLDGCTI